VSFGRQVKAKGVNTGSRHVDRTIGYITKYVTKDADTCHQVTTDPQRAHLERLWHELRVTPCSDRCANWLLYGIAPKKAHAKLWPGACKGRVHQRATLGIGGRRVLVSRDWSGKTLKDHRADVWDWVRVLLATSDDRTTRTRRRPALRPRPVPGRRRSPGNSSTTTTPTSRPCNTGSCAASPKPSNGANNAPPAVNASASTHHGISQQLPKERPDGKEKGTTGSPVDGERGSRVPRSPGRHPVPVAAPSNRPVCVQGRSASPVRPGDGSGRG